MLQAEWLVARDHKHKTMPGQLCSCPQPCVPSRMLCKPEEVYKWSHDNVKSKEVTPLVCPALLCAFSSNSLAFFPLIFLSFLVPLGWYHCFGKYHTKLSCSSTIKKMAPAMHNYIGVVVATQPLLWAPSKICENNK